MTMRTAPSGTRKPFTTFAVSRFLDRERLLGEVREAVERLRKRFPAIEAVYLFGSVASGIPTPRSDVDLLVVAAGIERESLHAEVATLPLPVDCHLLTPAGFTRQAAAGRGVAGAAVRHGIRLV